MVHHADKSYYLLTRELALFCQAFLLQKKFAASCEEIFQTRGRQQTLPLAARTNINKPFFMQPAVHKNTASMPKCFGV